MEPMFVSFCPRLFATIVILSSEISGLSGILTGFEAPLVGNISTSRSFLPRKM